MKKKKITDTDMMKPTMKVGLIAFIGLCVLFYQYHLSNVVRYDQLASFNGADSAAFISLEDDNGSRKITEDTVIKKTCCKYFPDTYEVK